MAVPSFDEWYAASIRRYPNAPMEQIRSGYKQRYDRDPAFTQGPSLDQWRSAFRNRYPDAPEEAADQEYEKRYNTLPWYSDVARGVKTGLGQLASTAGALTHALGAEETGQGWMDYAQDVMRANAPEAAISGMDVLDNPGLMARPDWWAYNLPMLATSMAPQLAAAAGAAMIPGGQVASGALGAAAFGTLGGLQEGFGGTYAQRLREGIPKEQALKEAGLVTGGVAGMSMVPGYRIASKAGGGLGSRAITGLIEGTTELAEEPLEAVITGGDPIQATREGFGVLPLAAITGGAVQTGKAPARKTTKEKVDDILEGVTEPAGEPARPFVPPDPEQRRRMGERVILRNQAMGRTRPISDETTKVTSSGTQIQVKPTIVEADSLITSFDRDYPQERQPRQRDRAASMTQIWGIATDIDPTLLDHQPQAGQGSPVGYQDDNLGGYIIVDGNARTEAQKQVYERLPENAQKLRDHLEAQGHDISGFDKPVQLDVIQGPVPVAYEIEANQPDVLALSASEQAQADARLVGPDILSRYRGGDIDLARNADFVRAFVGRIPPAQRNSLVDEQNRISQAGIRRIQGSLLAYAYGKDGNLPGLSRMLESADDNTRAITGAMIDAAPFMAELKSRVRDGLVSPEFDIGTALAGAAQRVSDARRNRQSISEVLKQQDAFTQLDPVERMVVELFANSRGRSAIAKTLQSYAETAMREGDTKQRGIFGDSGMTPESILAGRAAPELAQAARMAPSRDVYAPQGPRPVQNAAAEAARLQRFGWDKDRAIKEAAREGGISTRELYDWTRRQPQEVLDTLMERSSRVKTAENHVAPIVRKWRNGPKIHVVDTWAELPQQVIINHSQRFGTDSLERISAYRWNDNIYLVAARLESQGKAQRAVLHEGLGHWGVEQLLGPQRWAETRGRVLNLIGKDADITRIAADLRQRYASADGTPVPDHVLASEIVANMAESGIRHPLLDRLLAQLREFLRSVGFTIKFTRKELEGILGNAARNMESAPRGTSTQGQQPSITRGDDRTQDLFGTSSAPPQLSEVLEAPNEADIAYARKAGMSAAAQAYDQVESTATNQPAEVYDQISASAYQEYQNRLTGPMGERDYYLGLSNIAKQAAIATRAGQPYGFPDRPIVSAMQPSMVYKPQTSIGGDLVRQARQSIQEMQATAVAREAHEGQVDYDKKPYFPHVARVGQAGRNHNERLVGYLHDVVEDTNVTLEELAQMFPPEVIEAVDAITWREEAGEPYEAYFARVLANPLATAVKFYDTRDNMRLTTRPTPESEMMAARTRDSMLKAWEAMAEPKPPHPDESMQPSLMKVSIPRRSIADSPTFAGLPDAPTRKIDVMVNPDEKEMRRFLAGVDDDLWPGVRDRSKVPALRVYMSPTGDNYFWDAADAVHKDVVPEIGRATMGSRWPLPRSFEGDMLTRGEALEWVRQGDLFAMNPSMEGVSYIDQVLDNLSRISSTIAENRIDTTVSPDKAQYIKPQDDAAGNAIANVRRAWEFLETQNANRFWDPVQVRGLVENVSRIMAGGVVDEANMWREHEAPTRHIAVADMPAHLDGLYTWVADRLQNPDADPIVTAATFHRSFNHEIHPLKDGTGKTTEVIADWILRRGGMPLPKMPAKKEFYRNVSATKDDYVGWYDYFTSLFPSPPKPAAALQQINAGFTDNLRAQGVPAFLVEDYERLLNEPHVNDFAIELAPMSVPELEGQLEFAKLLLDTPAHEIAAKYRGFDDTYPEPTEDGVVLNADAARQLWPAYNKDRSRTASSHEPSSAWVKDRYLKLVQLPANPDRSEWVLLVGGGPGSGKTTSRKLLEQSKPRLPKLVYDAVLGGLNSVERTINLAEKFDNQVVQVLVSREIDDAWHGRAENNHKGVVHRAVTTGRPVPITSHINGHFNALNTAIELYKRHGTRDPNWEMNWYSNGRINDFVGGPEFFTPLPDDPTLLEQQLLEVTYDWYENGIPQTDGSTLQLSAERFRHLTGRTPEAYRGEQAGRAGIDAGGLAGREYAQQPSLAAPQPDDQGDMFGRPAEPPPPPPDARLESGGGSYSARQFGYMNEQEKAILREVFSFTDAYTAEERGGRDPQRWSDTEQQAFEQLVQDPSKVLEGLVGRMVGDTANATSLEAYGMMLHQQVQTVQESARILRDNPTDENMANMLSHYEKLALMQAPYAGYMTEAGRSLNILAKAKQTANVAGEILDAVPDYLVAKLRGSTAGSRPAMVALAEDILGAESVAEVMGAQRKLHEPTMFDKVYEYWINSILSGPDTHAVNMSSNALFQIVENAAQAVGSALPGGTPMRAALSRWAGMLEGVRQGAKLARQAWITEEPQLARTNNQKIEARHFQAIGGKAGKAIRTPGRALLAEDEFFKGVGYYTTAAQLAWQKALADGTGRRGYADIMANLERHPDIVQKATDEATRLTFTTTMHPTLAMLNRVLIKTRVGKFIAPFIRTPANILLEAIRYTPGAGAVLQEVRQDLLGKNGKQARAAMAGRWIVGAGIYTMTGLLTAAGKMSGNGPDDREERRLLQRTGWQPYSVKIGDQWVRYNRLEPVGMLLGLGADGLEISKYARGDEIDRLGSMIMGSLMSNLADKTFLSGVFDFAEAVTDPDRYGTRWINRNVSSFVPNIVAQPTWKMDPYVREANTLVDKIRGRIPGQREKLRPILDVAGEPIAQTSSRIPGVPIRASEQREDPLAETMLHLGLMRGKPGRTVQNTKLEDDEYSSYVEAMQGARWRLLTPYVRSPQFRQLMQANPEVARTMLDKLWTRIGSQARLKWLFENPDVLRRGQQAKARPRAIGSQYIQ